MILHTFGAQVGPIDPKFSGLEALMELLVSSPEAPKPKISGVYLISGRGP